MFILVLLIVFSLTPTLITFIWIFKSKKLGYSWKETWNIEMYNMKISHTIKSLHMDGYDINDIKEEMPDFIKYKNKLLV